MEKESGADDRRRRSKRDQWRPKQAQWEEQKRWIICEIEENKHFVQESKMSRMIQRRIARRNMRTTRERARAVSV